MLRWAGTCGSARRMRQLQLSPEQTSGVQRTHCLIAQWLLYPAD
jgi:hypothetical protein